jgi:hypothetical protein
VDKKTFSFKIHKNEIQLFLNREYFKSKAPKNCNLLFKWHQSLASTTVLVRKTKKLLEILRVWSEPKKL